MNTSKIKKTVGEKEFFKNIDKIQFEGIQSDNPLAFRYYDENHIIRGKSMREHFKFSVCYWHSFCGNGTDPFGSATKSFLWDKKKDVVGRAKDKMDAAFEFITKLGVPYYCFHDRDLIDEGSSFIESENYLSEIIPYAKKKQQLSGVELLWGTTNAFSHPRFMNGAATNPEFDVLAYAAAQVKIALDATIELGGENYVFWGGREGYMSLLNTDMKREKDHLAQFLHLAKDYARSRGFKGTFLIEPKPMEPTKHQYDFDAETVISFLSKHQLTEDFKLNIEVNHATLAQHTFQHELQVACDANLLGSIDANRGDYQNGWDTDQFPNNLNEIIEAMLVLLRNRVNLDGGINFDAKVRRNSTDLIDLFYAHIGSMDLFAKGLIVADKILNNSDYLNLRKERYRSFDEGKGREFEEKKLSLEDLYKHVLSISEPSLKSGKQELFENILNQAI